MTESIEPKLIQGLRSPAFPQSLFLSFEGIEGSGKSTQISLARGHLEDQGLRVILLREPGGTHFGERLRDAVLSTKTQLHPLAEAYLFAASRAQLLHEVIMKELSVPKTVVICDRYIDSTLVYQGRGRQLGHQMVLEIHQHFPLNIVPHQTFFLKIDFTTSMQRQESRQRGKDYFEGQNDNFYRKLIEGYDEVSALFPDRIKVIDASQNQDHVASEITKCLDALLIKNGIKAP